VSFSGGVLRVGVLSDTHGQVCPDVLAVMAGCDIAVHAGDVGSARVLRQLRNVTAAVHAVRGNNDVPGLWAGDELEVLATLSAMEKLQLPGGKLAVEHGHVHGHTSPDLDNLRAAHPGARVIVYGHTHKLLIDRSESPWIINPGAAGRIRNHGGPSCLVLHASPNAWNIETFEFASSIFARAFARGRTNPTR